MMTNIGLRMGMGHAVPINHIPRLANAAVKIGASAGELFRKPRPVGGRALDDDGQGFDILTDALRLMGEAGITRQEALPVMIDFVTAVSLIMAGEAAADAAIIRIRNRVADWKAGNFPSRSNETH